MEWAQQTEACYYEYGRREREGPCVLPEADKPLPQSHPAYDLHTFTKYTYPRLVIVEQLACCALLHFL